MIEPGWNCDDNNGQKCIFGNVSVSGENRRKLWAREKESWARRDPSRQSWQQYCQQSLKLWVWRRTGQKETLTMLIILTTILTTILSIWRDPSETSKTEGELGEKRPYNLKKIWKLWKLWKLWIILPKLWILSKYFENFENFEFFKVPQNFENFE